jgi:hypothetical protein
MAWMLWLWLGLTAVLLIFVIGRRRGYGALTLSYFLGLSLFHVPGLLGYLDPLWAPADIDVTEIGFATTLIGMTAFVCGAGFSRWLGWRRGFRFHRQQVTARAFSQLGWRLLVLGIIAYFVILPISNYLPSFTAAVFATSTVLIDRAHRRTLAAALRRRHQPQRRRYRHHLRHPARAAACHPGNGRIHRLRSLLGPQHHIVPLRRRPATHSVLRGHADSPVFRPVAVRDVLE